MPMMMNMQLATGCQIRTTDRASGDTKCVTTMESVNPPNCLISADMTVARKNDPNMFFNT